MSAENIIKRIKDDADLECGEIIAAANAKAQEIITAAQRMAAERQSEISGKAQSDCEEIKRRRLQIAELDTRKKLLATKREVLDEAMSGAMDRICNLPQADWEALIIKNVVSTAITGNETLSVRADQKSKFEALLDKINQELRNAGKSGNIKMAQEAANFAGGFALLGDHYELNCSFEVMLREVRSQIERKVTDMLFPVEV